VFDFEAPSCSFRRFNVVVNLNRKLDQTQSRSEKLPWSFRILITDYTKLRRRRSDSLEIVKINSGIRKECDVVKDHYHLNQGSSDLEALEYMDK
jgi:hypothetical protein